MAERTNDENEILEYARQLEHDVTRRMDKLKQSPKPVQTSDRQANQPKPRRSGNKTKLGPDKWRLRIHLSTTPDGKRRNLSEVFFGSAKLADRRLTAMLRDRDLGTLVLPDAANLNEYLDRWLKDAAKPRLSKQTFVDYESLLELHVRPAIGTRKLSDIRPQAIDSLYAAMTAKGLSARTVRYAHAVLNSAFSQAIKWNVLTINPCKAVTLPKREHREMKAFSRDEARRFLAACEDDKLGLLFAFALESGARPSEYLALKWSDLDFDRCTVTIQRALIRSKEKGGGWYFDKTKTKRSSRSVPMSPAIFAKLKHHRTEQLEHMLLLGTEYERHNLVFTNEFGRPVDLKNIRTRNFARILKAAGLDCSFRIYDLRHSTATLMLADGVNPKIVSERLGHASVVLTLDTYSHALPDIQKDATERLASMLYG